MSVKVSLEVIRPKIAIGPMPAKLWPMPVAKEFPTKGRMTVSNSLGRVVGGETLPPLPPASFFTHVTSLATQVFFALGEIERQEQASTPDGARDRLGRTRIAVRP